MYVCVRVLSVCVQHVNSVASLICFAYTFSLSLSCLSVGLVYPGGQRTKIFSDCLEYLPTL